MTDIFLQLPPDTQVAILRGAENKLNMRAVVIEKDIWVCWLLQQLFSMPVQMAFKGGTSLSKVFGLINRFSEDIDITIDYQHFIGAIDFDEVSRSKLKTLGRSLNGKLSSYIQETVLPFLNECLNKEFPESDFKINLGKENNELMFYYPSLLNQQLNYLRDHVLIEFGARNTTYPSSECQVTSLLSQAVDSIALPVAKINTLSPLRTFWEKATLIHVECHRNRLLETPERLSRHWYDLAMLANSWVGEQAITHRDVLESVIVHKKAFFNASYANYGDCLSKKFQLIPGNNEQKTLENDFNMMVDSGMFQQKPLSFGEIVEVLINLEKQINNS